MKISAPLRLCAILLFSLLVSCVPSALVVPERSADEKIEKRPPVTESVGKVREGVRDGARQLEVVNRQLDSATRSATSAKAQAAAARDEATRLREQGQANEEELAGMERQNLMLVDLVGKLEGELVQVRMELETAIDQRTAMEKWVDDAMEASIQKDAELERVSAERDRFKVERDEARGKLQGFADAEKKAATDAAASKGEAKPYKNLVMTAVVAGTLLLALVIFLIWLGRQNTLKR